MSNSHLYSCPIDNRPSAGFFGSAETDIDGLPVGGWSSAQPDDQAKARSAEAHRLVKALECRTRHSAPESGSDSLELYGIKITRDELERLNDRARYAERNDRAGWERAAAKDVHPSDFNLCWDIESRKEPQARTLRLPGGGIYTMPAGAPLPEVDLSAVWDQDGQKTHSLDIQTGELTRTREHIGVVGTRAVVEHLKWTDEYRIRTSAERPAGSPPTPETGPRITNMLTLDGARAISNSCRYMALKKGGYTTFLTLTFDDAARARIEERENVGPCTELTWIPKKKRYQATVTRLNGSRFEYEPGFYRDGWQVEPVAQVMDGYGYDQTHSTIQNEVSRFVNSAQKVYQRGWQEKCPETGKLRKAKPSTIVGWNGPMVRQYNEDGTLARDDRGRIIPDGKVLREKLHYCWVVEVPKNQDGKDNPHVHMMIKWRVPRRAFRAWAKRLERVWGQGMAHLEKIKEPEKAGSYMAKAAGYLTKGAGAADQGTVRGNRYGISAEARAPGWDIVGLYENGIMGSLVADVYDHFLFLHGSKIQKRNRIRDKLDAIDKSDKAQRKRVGESLEKVRAELNKNPEIPHRPSKYQLIIKGRENMAQFFAWASDKTGRVANHWLPKKEPGAAWSEKGKPPGIYLDEWKARQKASRRSIWGRRWDRWKGDCYEYWESLRKAVVPDWATEHDTKEAWECQIA